MGRVERYPASMGRHIELSSVSLGTVEVRDKGEMMRRQDSEKDTERPHAYSQFWLDISAGRRVIGESQPEEAETTEPALPQSSGRKSVADRSPGMRATAAAASMVEEQEHDEVGEPEEEAFTQEDMVDEVELPTLALDEPFTEAEELVEDEDDDDEEDEDEWSTRGGRKPTKPIRPTKPVKKPKPRRSF